MRDQRQMEWGFSGSWLHYTVSHFQRVTLGMPVGYTSASHQHLIRPHSGQTIITIVSRFKLYKLNDSRNPYLMPVRLWTTLHLLSTYKWLCIVSLLYNLKSIEYSWLYGQTPRFFDLINFSCIAYPGCVTSRCLQLRRYGICHQRLPYITMQRDCCSASQYNLADFM